MTRMTVRFGAMVALGAAVQAWTGPGQAGEEASTPPPAAMDQTGEPALSPDSVISRDAWRLRIDEARKRAEGGRQNWRLNAPQRMFEPDPPEKIATQRVLNDDTLQPGDIVSTDKGFFLFRGRSGTDEQTADFVPVAPR